jgi:hypothetical protein
MSRSEGSAELRVARDVFGVRLDDEVLLWNARAEQLHRLNPSATLVWDALAQWSELRIVSETLAMETRLEPDAIVQCVGELTALGLLEHRISSPDHSESSASLPPV